MVVTRNDDDDEYDENGDKYLDNDNDLAHCVVVS